MKHIIERIRNWLYGSGKTDEEIISLAEKIIENYKYKETKQRALAFLEYLEKEEDKNKRK